MSVDIRPALDELSASIEDISMEYMIKSARLAVEAGLDVIKTLETMRDKRVADRNTEL